MARRNAASHAEVRVQFPLWAKLGLLLAATLCLFVTVYGLVGFETDLDAAAERQRAKLIGVAENLATGLDGDAHARVATSRDADDPAYRQLRRWLQRARVANGLAWAGTIAVDDRGRQFFVIDGSAGSPYPVGYPIFDGIPLRREALETGAAVFDPALQDEWGTWQTASAPFYDAGGRAVGVVEVADDADADTLFASERRDRLLLEILLSALVAALVAVLFARWLNRHLRTLTTTALHVAAGELDREVDIRTRDEIGVLGGAFNTMVSGLRERQYIRDTLGRYVSKEVASQILARDELHLGGEEREVTVLMSDLRGFTSLSEDLGPAGMIALINRYFSRMAEVVHAHQGTIGEFVGDGMVVYFGAPREHPDDPLRAIACAVAMQVALVAFNAGEGRDLEMGVGVATGRVIVGNIGSEQRMKYGLVGNTINLAARLEAFTLGNQVLVDEVTRAGAGDGVRYGDALTMRAKGKRDPVTCWPVRAVAGGGYDVAMPEVRGRVTVPADFPVVMQRVVGKQVAPEELPAQATELGTKMIQVRAAFPAEARDSYRLALRFAPDDVATDVYAKVIECRPVIGALDAFTIDLAMTSVPERERERLANQLAPV